MSSELSKIVESQDRALRLTCMDAANTARNDQNASSAFHAGHCYASSCGRVTLYLGDCEAIREGLAFGAVVTDPPDIRWMADYPAVVWGGNNFCDQLPRSAGWLLWDKTHAETCRHSQAEIAWSNVVNTVRWHREAYHGFMRQRDGWFHPTQKPPGLMAWCMKWIDPELTVIDPYMGSGTTGIACVRQGRKFIGVERDPEYYAIAVERIRREIEGDLFHSQHNDTAQTPMPEPESDEN